MLSLILPLIFKFSIKNIYRIVQKPNNKYIFDVKFGHIISPILIHCCLDGGRETYLVESGVNLAKFGAQFHLQGFLFPMENRKNHNGKCSKIFGAGLI